MDMGRPAPLETTSGTASVIADSIVELTVTRRELTYGQSPSQCISLSFELLHKLGPAGLVPDRLANAVSEILLDYGKPEHFPAQCAEGLG